MWLEQTLEEFKRNYKWEYAHRLLGQGTALAFVGPLLYLYAKEKLPTSIHGKLLAVLGLGAAQMYVGRKMVRRNVEEPERSKHDGYLATFGLPAHVRSSYDLTGGGCVTNPHVLCLQAMFSLANMSLLLWTGFNLVSPASRAAKLRELTTMNALRDIGEVRRYFQVATGLFLGAGIAGTGVAEIDAGHAYNTFPKMGKHWIPDGLFEQTVSRMLSTSTAGGL